MSKKLFIKLAFSMFCCVLCLATVFGVGTLAGESSRASVPSENTAVTDCWWFNTCGHKEDYYSWPGYSVNSTGWLYRYIGRYVDPGDSTSVSESVSYSGSITAGLTFGTDRAKASLGVSGSLTMTTTITSIVNNRASFRQFVHAGVQYANRSNRITHRYRTYNPNYDAFGWNNYCQYASEYTYPRGKVEVSRGFSLFPYQMSQF